jgi:hypothetical protein
MNGEKYKRKTLWPMLNTVPQFPGGTEENYEMIMGIVGLEALDVTNGNRNVRSVVHRNNPIFSEFPRERPRDPGVDSRRYKIF